MFVSAVLEFVPALVFCLLVVLTLRTVAAAARQNARIQMYGELHAQAADRVRSRRRTE